ncbi:MAG: TonB-dependent receptor [Fluviicola sp.]|nr:TonB-dependent receptor [Fluviicola sp.]
MKQIILLTILILAHSSFSQTIKGVVIDKQSQATIPGAKVVFASSDTIIRTLTDIYGEFRLENLPLGRQMITISYSGYEDLTLPNLMVIAGKELDVKVILEERITDLEEVVVKGGNENGEIVNKMATVSTRSISIDDVAKYAGSLQDPARMAQNFAGVSGANDARNDIVIRGNSPSGVLWRMEGIDIPSPNHFSSLGTTGGPVSMLNINNLANSDFMTSAWSADYGNALSGVFDLQLRNGNHSKREYIAQVGFNGFEFGAEGPFVKGKRASYVLNYRYSTLGVISALGIDLGTGFAIPEYQDLTLKLDFPTKKAGRFSIFAIGGISSISSITDSTETGNLFFLPNTKSDVSSSTGIVGVSHRYFFNKNTLSKLVISASTQNSGITIDTLQNNNYLRYFAEANNQTKYSANYKINHKVNAKNTVTVGAIYDYFMFDIVDSVKVGNGYNKTTDFQGGASLVQSYIMWQHRFTNLLTLNAGLHSQHLLMNGSNSLEPRLGLKYKMSEKQTLSLGASMHSQMQRVPAYFFEEIVDGQSTTPNINLDFTRAIHSVIGHDLDLGKGMHLKSEVYYQYIYNAPIDTFSSSFSELNQGADFNLVARTGLTNKGLGMNYGGELTLEKFYSKGFYMLVTASVFESRYQGADKVWRNTAFNTNYVFNALGGKEFKIAKKVTLGFDIKVTYAGGRRYTPIDLVASQQIGSAVYIDSRAYSEQNPAYFRTDFKITFRMDQKKVSHLFSIDLQNVTNQKNIFLYGYNAATNQLGATYQRGFFPDVTYKFWF